MFMILYVVARTWVSDAHCSQNPNLRGRLIVGVEEGVTVVWVTRLFCKCPTLFVSKQHWPSLYYLYFFRNDSFLVCVYSAAPACWWLHSSKLGIEMIWQERLIPLPQLWFTSHKLAWPEVFMRSMVVRHCLGARDRLSACYLRSHHFICQLSLVTFWLLRSACERSGTVRYVYTVNFREV
jgi:hypothetical protein